MKQSDGPEDEGRVSPASTVMETLPTVQPTPGAERDVLRIMSSRASLAADGDLRAMAVQLLGAGYTPAEVSRRLKMHPGTVYDLTKKPEIAAAIADGVERRRELVGHGLQQAAIDAVDTLRALMMDVGVPPKERIKAAETLLERSGIAPDTSGGVQAAAAVSVDVDFDNRLARIVAGGGAQHLGD